MNNKNMSQSGNVLFLILIAVALFGALSYAATMSGRSSGGSAGSETSLIASSEITQYGTALENALTYLTVSKQCGVDEISFERAPFDGSDTDYVNPSAPSDFSCHVFHRSGGRAATMIPPTNANDGSEYAYSEVQVVGVGADQTACGADCSDIIVVLPNLNRTTCQKLNGRLVGDETISVQDDGDAFETEFFAGTFTGTKNIDGAAIRQRSLCVEGAGGEYYYYNVLMPR